MFVYSIMKTREVIYLFIFKCTKQMKINLFGLKCPPQKLDNAPLTENVCVKTMCITKKATLNFWGVGGSILSRGTHKTR